MGTNHEQNEDLAILDRISSELGAHSDAGEALQRALSALVEELHLESGWIILVDSDDDTPVAGRGFSLAAHHGLPEELDVASSPAWNHECNCELRCARGDMAGVYTEDQCPRLKTLGDSLVHTCAPLHWDGRSVGVLNLAATGWTPFDDSTFSLIARAARQMGAAAGRARLYERVRRRTREEHAALLEFTRELLSQQNIPELMMHLVATVRKTLGCDACALVVPDADRTWLEFAACVGWHGSPSGTVRRLRADDDCTAWSVMQSGNPISTPDISQSRVREWARDWVRAEGFEAQAAVPMIVGGESVGALLVHERRPRRWMRSEVEFLQLMANHAAIAMETLALREGARVRERLEFDLEMARSIQAEMLPPDLPRVPGWTIGARYEMARQVGGDFFDFVRWPDQPDRLGIVIGDAAGKNMSGALLMARGLESLRGCCATSDGPASVLEATNERVRHLCGTGHFFTCFYGELDVSTGVLRYASAGHEPALVWRAASGEVEAMDACGPALGIFPTLALQEGHVELGSGDQLVLYTDGVTDALDVGGGRRFGWRSLCDAVRTAGADASILESVGAAVRAHADGREWSDDMTLLVVGRI